MTSLSVTANEDLQVNKMMDDMMKQNAISLKQQLQQANKRAIQQNLLLVRGPAELENLLANSGYSTGLNLSVKKSSQTNGK